MARSTSAPTASAASSASSSPPSSSSGSAGRRRSGRAAAASSSAATRAPRASSSRRRSRAASSPPAATAVLAGVLPTPAVALLRLDLGVVISASHNPPEYNGVKFFDRDGRKLTDAAEEEIEALLDAPRTGRRRDRPRRRRRRQLPRARARALRLRPRRACASRSTARTAPTPESRRHAFEALGADVVAIGDEPDGTNINVGCGATDLSALCSDVVADGGFDLGIAFDGDGDRMLAVDANGAAVDGDQIVAILALDLGVDLVAVTTMTNLGFHPLMEQHGIRVAHDRRRRPLRARGAPPRGRPARRRAVRARHLPARPRHRRRARRGAAALRRARGPQLAEAAAVMERYPQVEAEPAASGPRPLPQPSLDEVDAAERGAGRRRRACSCARPARSPSCGCSPRRATAEEAETLCARIAALVDAELG